MKNVKLKLRKLLILTVSLAMILSVSGISFVNAASSSDKKLRIVSVKARDYEAPNFPKNTTNGIDWTGGYSKWETANNLDDRWSSLGKGTWIYYKLDKIHTVTKIEIAWHRPNGQSSYFAVYASTNAKNWTLVRSKGISHSPTTSKAACRNMMYNLKPTKALYVKIVGYGNTDKTFSGWTSIREVRIYGK